MPVTSYQNLPFADRSRSWDGPAAKKRVKQWATTGEGGEVDWQKYRRAFLWYDPDNPETEGGHKMPLADVIDGELKAILKGVQAAGGVLQGGRGGASIPASDVPKAKSHLDKYYKKARDTFDDDSIKAPWAKEEKGLALPRSHVRAEIPMSEVEIREAVPEDESDESVEFEGYGLRWADEATIGYFFRFTEKFQRGAFKKTIAERGPEGNSQIKFLRQHNSRQSVAAKILELKEDVTGLWFKARTIGTAVGRDLAIELREGVVDTLSIGFDVIQENINKDQDPILRTVIEARLYEISAVLWPAYAGATVEAVRALDALEDGEMERFVAALEAEVRDGELSHDGERRLRETQERIQQMLDGSEAGAGEELDEEEGDDPNEGSVEPDSETDFATQDLDVMLALREREMSLND